MSDIVLVSALRFDPSIERLEYRPAGETLAELIGLAMPGASDEQLGRAVVSLTSPRGTMVIPRARWRHVRPRAGITVHVRARIGEGALRSVLAIVITVAATFIAGPAGLGFALGSFGFTVATAVITTAGMLLLNSLVPLSSAGADTKKADAVYSIAGTRNAANPWGPVPAVRGTIRVYPVYAAPPYTEVVGDDQYLRCLFLVGGGPLNLADVRIGETPLSSFKDVQSEIRYGYPDDEPITLFPESVFEDQLNIELKSSEDWSTQRTATRCQAFSIDIAFPTGLLIYDTEGNPSAWAVSVAVQYRAINEAGEVVGDWIDAGNLDTFEAKPRPFRRSKRVDVGGPGRFEIRLQRVSADTDDSKVYDRVVWTALRSIRYEYPLAFPGPLALIALRIRASEQLSGTVDQLNVLATSVLPDWDSETESWIPRATSNPAAHFRDLLQGGATALPRTDDEINLAALQEWSEWCEEKGLAYNRYHDFDGSLRDCLAQVAAAGRASPTQSGGIWSVVIDRPQTVIRNHISPRNASSISGEMSYRKLPDAWRVRYLNEVDDYKAAELIVPRPGLDGDPLLFETIEFPGYTSTDLNWREGRRRFAELELRAETFYGTQDFEYLQAPRGSLVQLQMPVLSTTLVSARVAYVYDHFITLDDIVMMIEGTDYACRFRLADGTTSLWGVTTAPGERRTIELVGDETLPAVGDLALFGLAGYESIAAVVKSIEPQKDLAARLTLVPHAPEIEAIADEGADPPDTTPPADPAWSTVAPAAPNIVDVLSGSAALITGVSGSPVVVHVQPGGAVPVDHYIVTAQRGADPAIDQTVPASSGRAVFSDFAVGDVIEITAAAVSRYALESASAGPVEHTVLARIDLPADVASLSVAVLSGGTRRLTWSLDPDATEEQIARVAGFRIRARPGSGWAWDELAPLYPGVIASSPWDTVLPLTAGAHTIGIVSVDSSGRFALAPAIVDVTLAASSAPLLASRVESALTWPGTLTGGTIVGDGLVGGGPPSTLVYEVPAIDLGADQPVDVEATAYGVVGSAVITMQIGLAADGAPVGGDIATGLVTARYVALKITVTDPDAPAELGELVTLIVPA